MAQEKLNSKEAIESHIKVLEAAKETVMFQIKKLKNYQSSMQLKTWRRQSLSLGQKIKYWKDQLKSFNEIDNRIEKEIKRRTGPSEGIGCRIGRALP